MATLPFLARTHPEIERHIQSALEDERAKQTVSKTHIRLSSIGKCHRALWALRTGVPEEKPPDGRTLMTFDIGKYVEGAVIEWLRKAGYEVIDRDEAGQQLSVRMHRPIGVGHIDGMIRRLEIHPWSLLEIKTAKAKKFAELVEAASYAKWNREYADQLHGYMGASHETPEIPDLDDSLVFVVNKDTSDVWLEKIRLDPTIYEQLKERGKIAMGADLPAKPPEGKSQYCGYCKYCPVNAWCWSAATDARFDD